MDGAISMLRSARIAILGPNFIPQLGLSASHWLSARPTLEAARSGDQRNRHVPARIGTERESSDLPDNAEVAGSIPASPTHCWLFGNLAGSATSPDDDRAQHSPIGLPA